MANEKQVNVKVDDAVYADLEKCSGADFNRGVAGIARRLIIEGLPALKKKLGLESSGEINPVSAKHSKYAVNGRSKLRGKRGVSKQAES